MECPKCFGEMTSVRKQGFEVHQCSACNGHWFDLASASYVLGATDSPITAAAYEARIKGLEGRPTPYSCPSCKGNSIEVAFVRSVELEFCAGCGSVFFDPGEVAAVASIKRPMNNSTDSDRAAAGAPDFLGGVLWLIIEGLFEGLISV